MSNTETLLAELAFLTKQRDELLNAAESVALQLEILAYVTAGQPSKNDEVKLYALMSGQLQSAIASAKGGAA